MDLGPTRFGATSFHIMDECWLSSIPVGLGVQRGSPLREVLSRKLNHLSEAGIVDKWIKDELDRVGR